MTALGWSSGLAWRLGRQFLDPIRNEPVEAVVRRLGAIQAGDESAAELSIRARQQHSKAGDVAQAVADGRLIRTFAFRGATHLMTPEEGGVWLALRARSRMWELPSWRSYYRLEPSDWPALRETVRDALARGPLTRDELGAAVTANPRFAHLGFAFGGGSGTLLKPLAWLGEMSFGPSRDGRSTFQRLDTNPRWTGIPDLDDAGPRAIESYLGAYGPATTANLRYWLGEGLGAGGRTIETWLAKLGDAVATIEVEGVPALIRADDLDDLRAAGPSAAVRLLPAYDQWVLGPGTADRHIVPPLRRAAVSRGAAVVVVAGVVSGTWTTKRAEIVIEWFDGVARPPADIVARECARVAGLVGRTVR